MSTDQINDQPDGQIVPLQAEDAGTETRVTEATGPRTPTCQTGGRSASPLSPRTGAPGRRRGSM